MEQNVVRLSGNQAAATVRRRYRCETCGDTQERSGEDFRHFVVMSLSITIVLIAIISLYFGVIKF